MIKYFIFIIFSFVFTQIPTHKKMENLKKQALKNIGNKKTNKEFEKKIRQGQTFERSGLHEEAKNIYTDILKKDPGYTNAFKKIRDLLKNQNKFIELVNLSDKYITARPNDPIAKIDQFEIYYWADRSWNIIAEEIQGNFVCQTKNGNIQVEFLEGLCNLTTNNGDISTDYLTGSIVLDAIRGNIFGENIFGSVQAYTSDGNIDFKISYDSGSTDFSISLETVYGNIDVSLPKNLPVTIEAEIQGGKMAGAISSDIPITIEDTESKIFARGLVNQGTIPMNLFTGKGYITIRED